MNLFLLSVLFVLLQVCSQVCFAATVDQEKGELLKKIFSPQKGNEGGHAGDYYVMEFTALAIVFKENMTAEMLKDISGGRQVTLEDFQQVVDSVQIISANSDRVLWRGVSVAAINFPEQKLILLNRDYWRDASVQMRLAVVLHELMGLLMIEIDRWQQSLKALPFTQGLSFALLTDHRYSGLGILNFYGYATVVQSLGSSEICVSGSDSLNAAIRRAQQISLSKCHEFKKNCTLSETRYRPVIDFKNIGLGYCEVLVVHK